MLVIKVQYCIDAKFYLVGNKIVKFLKCSTESHLIRFLLSTVSRQIPQALPLVRPLGAGMKCYHIKTPNFIRKI